MLARKTKLRPFEFLKASNKYLKYFGDISSCLRSQTVDYFWSSLVIGNYSILKPHNFNNSNQRSAYGCNNAKNDNFDRKNSKQLLHLLLLQIKKVVIFFLQAPTNNKGVLNTTPPPLAFLNSHCLNSDLNDQKFRRYF